MPRKDKVAFDDRASVSGGYSMRSDRFGRGEIGSNVQLQGFLGQAHGVVIDVHGKDVGCAPRLCL